METIGWVEKQEKYIPKMYSIAHTNGQHKRKLVAGSFAVKEL